MKLHHLNLFLPDTWLTITTLYVILNMMKSYILACIQLLIATFYFFFMENGSLGN